jgi:iron complex transport system substrate-binding protein
VIGHAVTRRLTIAAGLMLADTALAAPTHPSAQRVVSLNPCLDQILVAVADRSQVAALSHYARDPQASSIAEVAKRYPQTFESAEEVMMLRPDLVLASRHSAPATREALTRLGVVYEPFSVPNTVKASLAQITRIAALVGHPDRGAALIARIDAALAAGVKPPGAKPVTVLVFQPRGFAAGDGTLMNEMLTRAGFVNVAPRYGIRQWGDVSLERLIADPPQLLLSGETAPGAPTWAERIVNHPALAAIAGRLHRAVLPERLLYCGGPSLIETAGILAAARRSVEAHA